MPNVMRGASTLITVACAGLVQGASAAYLLTPFEEPGATNTSLFDINNHGVLVGSSVLAGDTVARGFVFDGTSFTTLDGPAGALGSSALGISDGGVVVGSYFTDTRDVGGVAVPASFSSFIYDAGSYTSFVVAGASNTFLRGISPDGRHVAGYYTTATQQGVGFVYELATATLQIVSVPESQLTIAQGVNIAGLVVGSDTFVGPPPAPRPGFVFDTTSGIRTDLMIAGATRTALRSIDDNDVLAGWYSDVLGIHGFIGDVSDFEPIDFAGADSTFVEGANDARWVTGQYDVGDQTFSFVGRPLPLPSSLALAALGVATLSLRRRRRKA